VFLLIKETSQQKKCHNGPMFMEFTGLFLFKKTKISVDLNSAHGRYCGGSEDKVKSGQLG
jgi:hypothetical protein